MTWDLGTHCKQNLSLLPVFAGPGEMSLQHGPDLRFVHCGYPILEAPITA